MNINFDKTDRLIQVIQEAADTLNLFQYWMEHLIKDKKLSNMGYYTTKDGKKVDLNLQDSYFTNKISGIIRTIKKSYWQVGAAIRFTCPDTELQEVLEQDFKDEKDKDIIFEVVTAHEPTAKDIEKEFMSNLTDYSPDSVNALVDVYREYWKGHLAKHDDPLSIGHAPFDPDNEWHSIFHEAIELKLLTFDDAILIADKLEWIAFRLNSITDNMLAMFDKWQNSTHKEPIAQDETAIETKSSKVQLVAIMEILKSVGVCKSNTDLTKIVRIAAFLMGKSYRGLYNDANRGITFNKSFHKKDIDEINQLFKDANSTIKIDINKEY